MRRSSRSRASRASPTSSSFPSCQHRPLGAREAPSASLGELRLDARHHRLDRESLIFGWHVRSFADFRTSIGCLEVFIFLARYSHIAAIVLLVAMELDELVRLDAQRPRNRQELLPLVTGVIRG